MRNLHISTCVLGLLLTAGTAASSEARRPMRACLNPHSGKVRHVVDSCARNEITILVKDTGSRARPDDDREEHRGGHGKPRGAQGPAGPAGPAGGDSMRMVIDLKGVEVGVVELGNGLVPWKFGEDVVSLLARPDGFYQGPITFFHTSGDCTGDRYLVNNGGVFAYYGQLLGETVFYTRLADPSLPLLPETLKSYSIVSLGDPISCQPNTWGEFSVGLAIAATDPALNALVPPFRLR